MSKPILYILTQVEGQPNLLNEANKRIFEMMQGDTPDKIGGILAIGMCVFFVTFLTNSYVTLSNDLNFIINLKIQIR